MAYVFMTLHAATVNKLDELSAAGWEVVTAGPLSFPHGGDGATFPVLLRRPKGA